MKHLKLFVVLFLISCAGLLAGCHEHEFTEKVVEAATCGKAGILEKTCTSCGEVVTEEIPATGLHQYKDKVTKAPTCVATGVKTFTCSVCGDNYTEEIAATGKHDYKKSTIKQATCTTAGTSQEKCSMCGDTKESEIPATGHKWAAATCDKPKTCSNCNQTEGSALGHQWAAANCTTPQRCNRCGITQGNALGHTTGLGTCSRCNQYVTTLLPQAREIRTRFSNAVSHLNKSLDSAGKAINSSKCTGTASAVTSFGLAAGQMKAAVDACGNYPEFATVKGYLSSLNSQISNTFSGNVTVYGDSRDLSTVRAIINTMTATTDELRAASAIIDSWPK